jgi:hypothetical protein
MSTSVLADDCLVQKGSVPASAVQANNKIGYLEQIEPRLLRPNKVGSPASNLAKSF